MRESTSGPDPPVLTTDTQPFLVDIKDDTHPDILYTNGDTGPTSPREFYVNDGKGNYTCVENGYAEALTALYFPVDLHRDGDTDYNAYGWSEALLANGVFVLEAISRPAFKKKCYRGGFRDLILKIQNQRPDPHLLGRLEKKGGSRKTRLFSSNESR